MKLSPPKKLHVNDLLQGMDVILTTRQKARLTGDVRGCDHVGVKPFSTVNGGLFNTEVVIPVSMIVRVWPNIEVTHEKRIEEPASRPASTDAKAASKR